MWSNILHIKNSHSMQRNMHQQHIQSKVCFYFAVFQVKLLCFNSVQQYEMSHLKTVFENVKKAFHWGTSLHGPSSFADTCPCTNTSCRSFNTTSNTSDSVIFISKVLIILMRDFGPCFTSNGERAWSRCEGAQYFAGNFSSVFGWYSFEF